MKKIILFILPILLFSGCYPEDIGIKSTITVKNDSDATITVSSSDFETDLVLKPRTEQDVKIKSSIGTYLSAKTDNGWLTEVIDTQVGKKYVYTIRIYEYLVEYKITGTAKQVDITYHNDTDGTSQVSEVNVPWSKGFKTYKGTFVYVSAQNQGETGTVRTAIYHKGREVFKSESEGKYVIATSSGSLD